MGMEDLFVFDVKMSDRSRVVPVPSMTPASMQDITLPLFTQFNVLGTYDPRMDDPNTNNGNMDVSLDKIWSIFVFGIEETDSSDADKESIVAWLCFDRRCCKAT